MPKKREAVVPRRFLKMFLGPFSQCPKCILRHVQKKSLIFGHNPERSSIVPSLKEQQKTVRCNQIEICPKPWRVNAAETWACCGTCCPRKTTLGRPGRRAKSDKITEYCWLRSSPHFIPYEVIRQDRKPCLVGMLYTSILMRRCARQRKAPEKTTLASSRPSIQRPFNVKLIILPSPKPKGKLLKSQSKTV